jgi:hypothetical protein
MQTHIYRKKYVNGSVNSEGHLKKYKKQVRCLLKPRSIHLRNQKPNQYNLAGCEKGKTNRFIKILIQLCSGRTSGHRTDL